MRVDQELQPLGVAKLLAFLAQKVRVPGGATC